MALGRNSSRGAQEINQAVRAGSVAGGPIMEFGMARRVKTKEKYMRISMKEIWRNLDGPSKKKFGTTW